MIVYLIKSSLCMFLLWGFYALFLERENMHYTKRGYLIFSLIFALTIPLITFTYQTNAHIATETIQQPVTTIVLSEKSPIVAPPVDYLSILLWSVYGLGVLFFGFRFIKNLKNLTKKIKTNEQLKEPSHINVLVGDTIVPHTFLKYIFVPKKEYQEQNIPEEVLLHEKTHVTQKHTLDILFIEVLQVIFWCNPLLIFVKKAIKLNHEFLADQTVIKRQFSLQNYMNLLMSYPNSSNQTELSSPINYSLTKKRIIMMSQQFSKTRAAARLLLLFPMLLGCMLLFNNEIIAQQKTISYTKTLQDTHPDKKIQIRVQNEQITVNGTPTKLSNFAGTINDMTKQWKDNELTEFHFDVQIKNSDDRFVQKLNNAYKKTRLYAANPDGHDLIPPPPPLPPRVKKGEISDIPPPPHPHGIKEMKVPKPPKPPKVMKGEISDIPPPPSHFQTEEEIENEIEQAMTEAEQARIEAQIEREYGMANALEAAEQAREVAEYARAIAMEEAHKAREKNYHTREHAMEQAQLAREHAEHARTRAMEQSRRVHERVRIDRTQLREEARQAAEKAMKRAEKSRKEAMKEAQKARDEVRKQADKARKEARKAMNEARKEQRKALEKTKKEGN